MRPKSSVLINGVLLLSFLVAVVRPANADHKKKELAKQAAAAEQSGDSEQAEAAYCELTQEDKKNKTAAAKCDEFRQRNQQLYTKDSDAMTSGKAALADHRFADAIRSFQAVSSHRFHDQAAKYLTSVIPDAQRAFEADKAAREQAEARNTQSFKAGMEAYKRNDFEAAKASLPAVTGNNAAAAQAALDRIRKYERTFDEGFQFERRGKYKEAAARYKQVLTIKRDGPWEVAKKLARVEEQLKNSQGNEAATPASPADSSLADAIAMFYRGDYQQATDALQAYPADAGKRALALFYLGASELSLYLTSPPKQASKDLYDHAIQHFHAAHQMAPSFAPPEQYVSPRLLQAFKDAAQ